MTFCSVKLPPGFTSGGGGAHFVSGVLEFSRIFGPKILIIQITPAGNTAAYANEKRPTAWRDMLWIEFQRLVASLFGVLPPPPFDIAFRLSLRIFFVSVRVGAQSTLF